MKYKKKVQLDDVESDSVIIERIKNADEKALISVYQKCYRLIGHMVYKNGGTNEEAKDICQNAVLIFWQKARSGNLTLTSKITTFVYGIARNQWLRELERKKRLSYTEIDSGELTDMDKIEREKIITQCLSQLDKRCRRILMYHYYDEMSSQQLADKLKLANANSAKSKKYKCQQRLIQILKAQYSENDFF